ncbi:MAG: 2-C-methyl-D-erythritol 4-phosphate cytidylyltransferase, partial [Candidatus Margulisiibacteriota bacterium]
MKTSAIIAAGGSGSRMKTDEGKLFIELRGIPIILLTLSVFDSCDIIDEIILPVPLDEIGRTKQMVERAGLKKVRHIIRGGETRQASVYNGLQVVSSDSEIIV